MFVVLALSSMNLVFGFPCLEGLDEQEPLLEWEELFDLGFFLLSFFFTPATSVEVSPDWDSPSSVHNKPWISHQINHERMDKDAPRDDQGDMPADPEPETELPRDVAAKSLPVLYSFIYKIKIKSMTLQYAYPNKTILLINLPKRVHFRRSHPSQYVLHASHQWGPQFPVLAP